MNRPLRTRRLAAMAVAALLPLTAVACTTDGGGNPPATTSAASPPASTPTAGTTAALKSPSSSAGGPASTPSSGEPASQPSGSGCPNLPDTGVGSAEQLGEQGAAAAVAEIPQLSQLSVTLRFAELEDTLNSAQDVTLFAPTDAAFRSIGLDRGRKLVTDPQQAVKVLKYHVVTKRLTPEELAGSHETLEGKPLTVQGSGEDFTVGAGGAKVVCGNLQAANATIYLIDQVLQP